MYLSTQNFSVKVPKVLSILLSIQSLPKMQNTPKNALKTEQKTNYLSISWPDSAMNWFQLYGHRFQVELDELYKIATVTISIRLPLPPLKCQKSPRTAKISVFPGQIRLWTGSNSALTGSE
jgi:hypothetical protein